MQKRVQDQHNILDWQFAFTRQLLIEPHRNPKKKSSPYKVKDFLLFPSEDSKTSSGKRVMTPEEQLNYVKYFLAPLINARNEQAEKEVARKGKKKNGN